MWRRVPSLTLMIAFACGGPPADGPDQDTRVSDGAQSPLVLGPAQVSGEQLFQTMCWTCHGKAGRGDGPAVGVGGVAQPPNFHTAGYAELSATDLERRFAGVWDGDDPTHPHMQYVAAMVQREPFMEALAYIPMLAYPAELPGSALAGQALFMERCAACHGEDGSGVGVVADALLVPAADLTADTLVAARDFEAVFEMIKGGGSPELHGSSMPAWGTVFDDGSIWDLVAYVASLQPGVLSDPPAAGR